MVIKGSVLRLTAKTTTTRFPFQLKESPVTFRKETWFCFVVLWFHKKASPLSTSPKKEAKYQHPSISRFVSVSLAPVFFFQGSITYFLCHTTVGWGRCQFLAASISTGSGLGDGSWNLSPLKFEIDCSKMVTPHLNRDIFSKPSLLVSMLKFLRCKFGREVVEDFGDVFVLFLVVWLVLGD